MSIPQSCNGSRIVIKLLSKILILLVLAAGGGIAIWSFVQERLEAKLDADDQPLKAPRRVSNAEGEPAITLEAEELHESGLQTSAVEKGTFPQELRCYG